mmetsp:Transcript_72004/g.198697  ORF Transcript_72004/g.198697 Transcript_72004/m.198697 type:complete len:225 (+) Transcript_72004:1980-2654(+)
MMGVGVNCSSIALAQIHVAGHTDGVDTCVCRPLDGVASSLNLLVVIASDDDAEVVATSALKGNCGGEVVVAGLRGTHHVAIVQATLVKEAISLPLLAPARDLAPVRAARLVIVLAQAEPVDAGTEEHTRKVGRALDFVVARRVPGVYRCNRPSLEVTHCVDRLCVEWPRLGFHGKKAFLFVFVSAEGNKDLCGSAASPIQPDVGVHEVVAGLGGHELAIGVLKA